MPGAFRRQGACDRRTGHGAVVERERVVNDAVRQLKLTKLIIAHRPETIASADRVLVMREAHIEGEVGGPSRQGITQENIMTLAAGVAA